MKTTRVKSDTVQQLALRELQRTLGVNWRRVREEHDTTLYELCRRTGISYSVACDIESCRQESTNIEDCRKAAEFYGMSFDEYFRELTRGISSEDPVPYKDITRADLHDVFPYNLVMMITGEIPNPADVNLKGVAEAISALTDMEQRVILSMYKYNNSLEDTGKTLEMSRDQVRNIESKALRKLRHKGWVETMKVYSINDFVSSRDTTEGENEDEDTTGQTAPANPHVVILYSEIRSEFMYPDEEVLPEEYARKALARATALVFSNFVLLRNQKPEDYARSRKSLVEENRARISIINQICDANYIGAYYEMRQWLDNKTDSDYLSYDEAQFLSTVHIVLEGTVRSARTEPGDGMSKADHATPAQPVIPGVDHLREEKSGTPIEQMGLSNRALNVLRRIGCTTSEDINNVGRRELKQVRGCGSKVIEELSVKMTALGYDWYN